MRQTSRMTVLDHLGITVDDLPRAKAQFHPVLEALGFTPAGLRALSLLASGG